MLVCSARGLEPLRSSRYKNREKYPTVAVPDKTRQGETHADRHWLPGTPHEHIFLPFGGSIELFDYVRCEMSEQLDAYVQYEE